MSNTVLGVPLKIDIKEPSKKQSIINLLIEIKKQSDDKLLNNIIDSALKGLGFSGVELMKTNSNKGNSLVQNLSKTFKSFNDAIVNNFGVYNEPVKKLRKHKLDSSKDIIKSYLDAGFNINKICKKLKKEHNITENYQNVRNYIIKNKLI